MCLHDHQVPLQDVHPEHQVQHGYLVILVNPGFGVSIGLYVQEHLLDKFAKGRLCQINWGKLNSLSIHTDSMDRNHASRFL